MTPSPYYDDGSVTIYLGDCMEILPALGRFDIAVTSPPYNMGLVPGGNGRGMYRPGAANKAGRFRDGYHGGHDDAMPQEEYDAWQRAVLADLYGRTDSAVFYNHRPRVEHGRLRPPLSMDFGDIPLRQIIIWDRGTGIDVNLRAFCTRQEWILLFAKPEFKLVDHATSGMGDVWRLGMETGVPGHPAPIPGVSPCSLHRSYRGAVGDRPVHGFRFDSACGQGRWGGGGRDRAVRAVLRTGRAAIGSRGAGL